VFFRGQRALRLLLMGVKPGLENRRLGGR